MDEIVLRLSTVDGTSRIITCSASLTLEEVLAQAELPSPELCCPIFTYQGRVLPGYLSLQFHKIPTGANLAVGFRREPGCGGQFLRDVPPCTWVSTYFRDDQLEERRLADLAFAIWENCRDFGKLMTDLARQQDAEDELDETRAFPTVVQSALGPSEAPLPTGFKRRSARWACSWFGGQIDF
jgi:hypothetical protein